MADARAEYERELDEHLHEVAHAIAEDVPAEWYPSYLNKLLEAHAAMVRAESAEELAAERKKVADMEKPAAFGWQCYQDRCENAYVEASVVKRMDTEQRLFRETFRNVMGLMKSVAEGCGLMAEGEAKNG